MHFEINDNTVLADIQRTFKNHYPYLSISFYRKQHKKYESSNVTDRIPLSKKISEIRKTHISTLIEILPTYSVIQVEKEFQERLGLTIQILKKEKDKWEQSTGLDNLSLKDLNILGQNSSDEFVMEDDDEKFEINEE